MTSASLIFGILMVTHRLASFRQQSGTYRSQPVLRLARTLTIALYENCSRKRVEVEVLIWRELPIPRGHSGAIYSASTFQLNTELAVWSEIHSHTSHAQNSPQDYLNGQNVARAQVGVGHLTWNNIVVAYAQNYANSRIGNCNLIHSNGPYGENLAKGTGSFTVQHVWGDKIADIIPRWCGENQSILGALGFYSRMDGVLCLAIMIPQATILESILTKDQCSY
ncbi:hypothetical protein HYC85_015255 [Camellia sinensis]|uniref:SCP domain-containing protein n=1 Tax=Camellia sinensis TaxID=4442 RepID=A0A7J7GX51_CAMSI|nr:hypothetical protein HYC85_015255 [Camellia sinensis]